MCAQSEQKQQRQQQQLNPIRQLSSYLSVCLFLSFKVSVCTSTTFARLSYEAAAAAAAAAADQPATGSGGNFMRKKKERGKRVEEMVSIEGH